MNVVMVCVDYWDILSLTLPSTYKHFDKVVVVTAPHDKKTMEFVSLFPNTQLHVTDVFYKNGCTFNKGAAIEEGFDVLGREGWIAVMDADIILPSVIHIPKLHVDNLYTPFRRMCNRIPSLLPTEDQWMNYPLHHQEREFAGYLQIFNGSSRFLNKLPWYSTNWKHGGGCDSDFQAKWPEKYKVRPSWNVLHLGEAGAHWQGRATPFLDGTVDPKIEERKIKMNEMFRRRRQTRSLDHEKF